MKTQTVRVFFFPSVEVTNKCTYRFNLVPTLTTFVKYTLRMARGETSAHITITISAREIRNGST